MRNEKHPICFTDPLAVEEFVTEVLSSNPNRLRHSLVVADKVRQCARDINERQQGITIDENLAYCAALLHDVGYWEEIAKTSFHPIDGAEFLKNQGFPFLASLIASHGFSSEEAELRGEKPIPISEDIIAKLITYADLQVGPEGESRTYEERLNDIVARYGESSLVSQAGLKSRPRMREVIEEIDRLLGNIPNA